LGFHEAFGALVQFVNPSAEAGSGRWINPAIASATAVYLLIGGLLVLKH
jgi:hypothetical protein